MVRFVVIGVFAVLCAAGLAQRLNALGDPGAPHPVAAVAQPSADAPPPAADGEAAIAKSGDGHFWADGQVDGHPVHFLIDTGATSVFLTSADARSLGIDPSSLAYSQAVTTANGPAHAAPVKLGEITVGGAQVADVQAFVIDNGLETSLLGMSFLGRLTKFEATQDTMTLKS
ncbi:MAG TPA: TIGR02281 family clan AA aspartic protease [Caulobacteraceae bacterium]